MKNTNNDLALKMDKCATTTGIYRRLLANAEAALAEAIADGYEGYDLDEFEEAVREAREVLDRETATQLVAEDTDVERLESILADVGIYGILDADDQGGWLTVTASETQRGAGGERFSLTNLRATLSTFGIDVTCFYRDGVFGIFAADVDAIR